MSENKATRLMRLMDELAEAAKRVGFEVRREKILREIGYRARGGACRLREQELLILDRDQAPADQIEVLAEALRGRDSEQIYPSPAARRVATDGTRIGLWDWRWRAPKMLAKRSAPNAEAYRRRSDAHVPFATAGARPEIDPVSATKSRAYSSDSDGTSAQRSFMCAVSA